MHTIWTDLIVPGVPLAEKVIRTVAVYVFLLVGLRLAGKRELGQLNPFDLVVLFLLSNTVQNAIIGSDNSLSGGILGAALLLLINYVVVRYLYEHPALDRFLAGDTELLIRHGRLLEHRLRRELITREELAAAARRQGFAHLDEVETCRLEVGGSLTFVAKHPTTDDQRHREVLAKLEEIEKMIRERGVRE
ncbi:MAG TPA: YetF domain-containing protein [Gemmatimonadaceae bacterium]